MFKCTQCHKVFTRKDTLLRHIKTLHGRSDVREFSSNNATNVTTQSKYTTGHYLFDPLNKQASNNIENKTLSVRDALSESNYESDDGRNDSNEDIPQALQNNNNESYIAESEERLNPFEKRIQAARQAVQSKFDYLRSQRDMHKAGSENNNEENEQKELIAVSGNHGGSTLIPNLIAALQTTLDILLIKELQSTAAEDECEEVNSNRRSAMKRPITFNLTEENENGELQTKHIKYNNSAVLGNDNINYAQSKNVVRKDWYHPNTLVAELRHLIATTETGQQIFKLMLSLKSNNNVEHEKQRKELNGLKQTRVGQKIFSIIHELQKAEIIEPLTYYLDEPSIEDITDYEEEDNDNTDDNSESPQ